MRSIEISLCTNRSGNQCLEGVIFTYVNGAVFFGTLDEDGHGVSTVEMDKESLFEMRNLCNYFVAKLSDNEQESE